MELAVAVEAMMAQLVQRMLCLTVLCCSSHARPPGASQPEAPEIFAWRMLPAEQPAPGVPLPPPVDEVAPANAEL